MQHLKSRKLYLLIFAITAILLQNQIAEARFNSGCNLEEKSCWGLLIALIVGGIVLAGYWICVISNIAILLQKNKKQSRIY